jgi:UDP-N-acetylmuramoyl-tripeptide--D-alanyl-D-alanine ligase
VSVPGLVAVAARYGACLLVCDDTLASFQAMAAAYLDLFPNLLRIGITGSSGKTTTKELAAAMIGREKCVTYNEGNLNSETGLPLSVFNVRACHEVMVAELGMNKKGEIKSLAKVFRPQIAIVLNIGLAHTAYLGGKRGIAAEKKEIFSRFSGGEQAFIPKNDEYASFLAQDVRGKVRFFDFSTEASWGGAESAGVSGSDIVWEGKTARFPLPGTHNLRNALAAAILARAAGVTGQAVRDGLEAARPLFGRGEVLYGAVTVIRDCYNANPDSMTAALDFCDSLDAGLSAGLDDSLSAGLDDGLGDRHGLGDGRGRRVYIIGAMLELGEDTEAAHACLGRRLAASQADAVFLFGQECKAAWEAINTMPQKTPPASVQKIFWTDDMDALKAAVAAYVQKGDLVLLKGSRGCALERVEEALPCS